MDLKSLGSSDSSVLDDVPKIRRRLTAEWSKNVLVPEEDSKRPEGILAQLYQCISLFCRDVLDNLDDFEARETEPMSMPLYRTLDSVYDSLMEWGDDFKVGSGNLDDSLKDSQDLRQFTIKLMIGIAQTLTNDILPAMVSILEAVQQEHTADSLRNLQSKAEDIKSVKKEAAMHARSYADADDKWADDDDSPSSQSDSSILEDALENLKSNIEALVELGTCLEQPVKDTIFNEPVAPPVLVAADSSLKYQAFFDGIKQKFPRCDDSLARALSKAIYETTMRLHRERQEASGEATDKPDLRSEFQKDSGYETGPKEPSHLSEGLGEGSIARGSSYARSLASYADAEDGTTRTPFPSQPKDLRIGEKFPCMACGRLVAKSEASDAWRRHLLSDLRPWICCQVACDCPRTPYRVRAEWYKHLQAQHELHPTWNDKNCPFCLRTIAAGGHAMIRHVERHLRQLSLAALTANPDDGSEDSGSEHGSDIVLTSPGFSNQPGRRESESVQDHPLYTCAAQGEDGLWHCPWEGEGYCHHKPTVLRAEFDKFVRYHLDSLRCKVEGCKESSEAFATQEILYLHEQKEHGMHKGGGRFLCTSPGCGRSRPGNGFANRWVQLEHIKNVHENIPDLPVPPEDG